MADRVRFIACTTEEYNNSSKESNCLYFIESGDLKGALYKGKLLIGKDYTTIVKDIESNMEGIVGVAEWLDQRVDRLEQGGTGSGSLVWKEF